MSTPLNQTTDFGHRAAPASAIGPRPVADWERLAKESTSRADFLRRIASGLQTHFNASIVAIQAFEIDTPSMFFVDERLARDIDREALRTTLRSLGSLPVASDIRHANGTVRSLGIELSSAPDRSAVLVVLPSNVALGTTDQIQFLKQLRDTAQSVSPLLASMKSSNANAEATSTTDSIATSSSIHPGDLSRLHLDLDLTATTYRIANESRRLLAADRVSVLTMSGKNFRVAAVSGVAVVDRRSNTVRASEKLCRAASVLGRAVVLPADEDLREEDLPPQITGPLDEYLDESGVMTVVLLPLAFARGDESNDATARDVDTLQTLERDYKQSGMMMLEYFAGSAPTQVTESMELVRRDSTLALRNALEHRVIFGLSIWKAIGRVVHGNKRLLWIALSLAVLSAVAAGFLIQVDHQLIATGTIQPTERRQVFANLDGTVKQLHVHDGQVVRAGDVLIELENAELQSQAESIAGEIQTKLQRLASTRSVRLSGSNESGRESQLALEQRQLESELENLKAQTKIIHEMQAELKVLSPIDGRVVAWQLEKRLKNRPVGRGNVLLTVVDYNSPWQLNLEVADEDAGTVLASLSATESLPVRFAVATEPTRTYDATLVSVSTASRIGESGKQVMDAIANVDANHRLVAELFDADSTNDGDGRVRVGSGVTAKVVCGKRSAITSWFSDLIDFTNRKVLFYFR